jgi:membrane protein implicated in regulation of membrane protease activity
MKFRLIWAIISVIVEEIAIVVIALMVLPLFDIHIPVTALVLIMVGWLLFSALLFIPGNNALLRKPVYDKRCIIGQKGVVAKELNPKGLVKIDGELWGAESAENIATGEEVIVTGYSGIKLKVARYTVPSDKIE